MSVIILGSGRSGKAVFEYLQSKNIKCFYAKNEDINAINFENDYINNLLKDVNLAVISPGISLKNELVFQIKKRKIALYGELEFGYNINKFSEKIIAITGTNGKTTTVSLVNYLLNNSNNKSVACGNIGLPFTEAIKNKNNEDYFTIECSSFQLETINKFRPKIAVILNVTPDHLNRHDTIKNYVKCKFKITKNQQKNDYLILNADDEFLQKNKPKTKAKIFYFSTKRKVIGCFLKNKSIYFNDGFIEEKIIAISKIRLLGDHNLSNCLAAILSCYLITKNKVDFSCITKFSSVAHRLEFVKKINEVSFYNDSKSTNISSTLVAINSFKNGINLILGGSDKNLSFDELFAKMPVNVRNIAIFGETKTKIALFAKEHNYKNIYICDNLQQCVKLLFSLSKPNDILLLSPACASFDCFSNYEERGNFFKKIVREIELDENNFFEFNKKT